MFKFLSALRSKSGAEDGAPPEAMLAAAMACTATPVTAPGSLRPGHPVSALLTPEDFDYASSFTDVVGISSAYDRKADVNVTVLGRPGEVPIGLLMLYADARWSGGPVALRRWLEAKDCWAVRKLFSQEGPTAACTVHELLATAAAMSSHVVEQTGMRVGPRCYCDTVEGSSAPRMANCIGLTEAGASYVQCPERDALHQVTNSYLKRIEELFAQGLEANGFQLTADRLRVVLRGFPAIKLVDTEASAF